MSKFAKALEQAAQEQALRTTAPAQLSPPAAPGQASKPAAPARPSKWPAPATAQPSKWPAPARSLEQTPLGAADVVPSLQRPASRRLATGSGGGLDEHFVSLIDPTSFEAEQYRMLRYLVEQHSKSTDLRVIAVSSPGDGDGKTTTAVNLAGSLAQASDAQVLLIDADLRKSELARKLGLEPGADPGLVEAILNGNVTLDSVVREFSHLNLSFLTTGRLPSTPYEVLKSPRFGALLSEARKRYDYIVLDTPPMVSVPDCRVIGRWVDGFLVVVTAHRTPRKLVEEALSVIEPAKVLGLVFNNDDRHLSRTSSYAQIRRR